MLAVYVFVLLKMLIQRCNSEAIIVILRGVILAWCCSGRRRRSWYNSEWWPDYTEPMDDSWWCSNQYLSA